MAAIVQGLKDFGSAVRAGAGRYMKSARGVVTRSAKGALNWSKAHPKTSYTAGGALSIGGGAYVAKKLMGGKASTGSKKRRKSRFGR